MTTRARLAFTVLVLAALTGACRERSSRSDSATAIPSAASPSIACAGGTRWAEVDSVAKEFVVSAKKGTPSVLDSLPEDMRLLLEGGDHPAYRYPWCGREYVLAPVNSAQYGGWWVAEVRERTSADTATDAGMGTYTFHGDWGVTRVRGRWIAQRDLAMLEHEPFALFDLAPRGGVRVVVPESFPDSSLGPDEPVLSASDTLLAVTYRFRDDDALDEPGPFDDEHWIYAIAPSDSLARVRAKLQTPKGFDGASVRCIVGDSAIVIGVDGQRATALRIRDGAMLPALRCDR